MVGKILTVDEAVNVVKQQKEHDKKIVLVGGCFDILHIGHVIFLQRAKEQGNILIVLLESDERIRRTKGNDRPINIQHDRAQVLASLEMVDYVILLPDMVDDASYDKLILQLKPDIIATTAGDPAAVHKQRQATLMGSKVIEVAQKIDNQSTTRLSSLISASTWKEI